MNTLLEVDSETLKISKKKNGRMGQTLHHKSTGRKRAMTALERRVYHIIINKGTKANLICDVWRSEAWTEFTRGEITRVVITTAKNLKPQERGVEPGIIGAHSLQEGGAMALKTMGYKNYTIRKFGLWTLDTWQMYIHSQITKL